MATRSGAGLRARAEGGWLAEAHPTDRLFIASLRRWLDGPGGQAEVWSGLAGSLGAGAATRLLGAFEALLRQVAGAARRKLQRHATNCPCIGEDEALLAGMVRAAGRGDTESAHALAAQIVRETDLLAVLESAARLGQLMDNIGGGPVTGAEARAQVPVSVRPTIH